jgi:hypothetical protein
MPVFGDLSRHGRRPTVLAVLTDSGAWRLGCALGPIVQHDAPVERSRSSRPVGDRLATISFRTARHNMWRPHDMPEAPAGWARHNISRRGEKMMTKKIHAVVA